MELSIITIGTFVAILNQGTKYIAKNFIKHDVSKWIPVCSVVYGIILGIIGFIMPDVDMGNNLLEAIKKVGEGDMSRENVMNAAKLLMLVTSATQYGKGKYRGYKINKAAKEAGKVGVYVKDETGKVHELIIHDDGTNNFASQIRENIKNPNRVK